MVVIKSRVKHSLLHEPFDSSLYCFRRVTLYFDGVNVDSFAVIRGTSLDGPDCITVDWSETCCVPLCAAISISLSIVGSAPHVVVLHVNIATCAKWTLFKVEMNICRFQ